MADVICVWHPDSPGMRIPVRRGWIGRLFKPAAFATLREIEEYYKALELVGVAREVTAWDRGEHIKSRTND